MTSATVLTSATTYAVPQPTVQKMWEGGPLRSWSPIKTSKTPIGYKNGFVGSYVCGRCGKPCDGVYPLEEPSIWLCGPCKTAMRPAGGAE
jgi:hypothetical protein